METALVVDIGNKEATIIPVYCGVQVLRAWQAQAIAAEAVHDEIKKQLVESGIDQELLTPEIIEDIKGINLEKLTLQLNNRFKRKQYLPVAKDLVFFLTFFVKKM